MSEGTQSTEAEVTDLKGAKEPSPQAKEELSPPDRVPDPLSNPKASRKRTKTGCLTCRKRRIKCGEERPICRNCIKSKRACEGYNPRVIFKDPLGAIRQGTGFQNVPVNPPRLDRSSTSSSSSTSHSRGPAAAGHANPLPAIAPRPVAQYEAISSTVPSQLPLQAASIPFSASIHSQNQHIMGSSDNIQTQAFSISQTGLPMGCEQLHNHTQIAPFPAQGAFYSAEQPPTGIYSGAPTQTQPTLYSHLIPHAGHSHGVDAPPTGPRSFQGGPLVEFQPSTQHWSAAANYGHYQPQNLGAPIWHASVETALHADPSLQVDIQSYGAPLLPMNTRPEQGTNIPQSGNALRLNASSTNELGGDAMEHEEEGEEGEEYWDVETDNPVEDEQMLLDAELSAHDHSTGLVRALHATQDEKLMRSFTSFLNEPNILSTYRPSMTATPLLEPKTARIFCHFITATGPSLSIFERHPMNPSVILTGAPVPRAQQSLWTYVLPLMALHHQGLLHAMLALASLHIAKLQNTSTTPSLKHYHYALRRVGKCVGSQFQRLEIATLAATLLLGFYEVMTAEHTKWNSHLSGAKQLIVELNLAEKSQRLRAMKREAAATVKRAQDAYFAGDPASLSNLHMMGFHPLANPYRPEDDIDEKLVSKLMGRQFRYDYFGRVIDGELGGVTGAPKPPLGDRDIESFETQQDLFWWYCKQDVYQSILSGNPLLLDYERWADCAPRAPIGRLNAVYGTVDHLVLVLGRIANFTCHDLRRKKRVIKSNGGVWRPPGNSQMGAASAAAPSVPGQGYSPKSNISHATDLQGANAERSGSERSSAGTNLSVPPPSEGFPPSGPPGERPPMGIKMPSMYGMVPSDGPAGMPRAFASTSPNPSHPSSSPSTTTHYPAAPGSTDAASAMPGAGTSAPPRPATNIDDIELEAATVEAEDEWNQINDALKTFEDSLGPEYRPLSPEYMQPTSTPFGPAIYYRTYSMACMWALFYMARIIAARVRPSMPPAAMVAAGIAARETSQYANLIGRISAGIRPTPPSQPLNPSLGAALVEVSLPLFFAGVQYADSAQRNWVIARLMDVTRRTGWRSSAAIAAGCETAWKRAAEAGRGPPYLRRTDPFTDETLVAGNRIPWNANKPDGSDHGSAGKSASGNSNNDDNAKAGDLHAQLNNRDRRFITVNSQAKLHWALGLLAVEEDIARLDVN